MNSKIRGVPAYFSLIAYALSFQYKPRMHIFEFFTNSIRKSHALA